MKRLWFLCQNPSLHRLDTDNPWQPWYDTVDSFVIRADSEVQARSIAQDNAGGEQKQCKDVWLNPKYSICKELLPRDGESCVIVRSFNAA